MLEKLAKSIAARNIVSLRAVDMANDDYGMGVGAYMQDENYHYISFATIPVDGTSSQLDAELALNSSIESPFDLKCVTFQEEEFILSKDLFKLKFIWSWMVSPSEMLDRDGVMSPLLTAIIVKNSNQKLEKLIDDVRAYQLSVMEQFM